MALIIVDPVAAPEVQTMVSQLDSELQFLLDNSNIPKEVQAKVAASGIKDVAVFACIEADAKDFRDFVKTGLGIDPAACVPNKVLVAKMVSAWQASVARGQKRREEEAEQRVGDLPRKLSRTSHIQLSKGYTEVHGENTPENTPHPDYLESKLQQLEDGLLLTESMLEIVSMADDDELEPQLGVVLQFDMKLKARRTTTKKAKIPRTTEELRTKFKVVAAMWELIRLRSKGKPYLKDYDMRIWDRHVEFLLGDTVYGIKITATGCNTTCTASWGLVLEYDLELRKRFTWAFNNMDGKLVDFLRFARKDHSTYQLRFLNPLSVEAGAAAAKALVEGSQATSSHATAWTSTPAAVATAGPPPPVPAAAVPKKGKAKGAGKGAKDKKEVKGMGKDKGKKEGIENQICYRFQRGKCFETSCPRRHICNRCGNHLHGEKECRMPKPAVA